MSHNPRCPRCNSHTIKVDHSPGSSLTREPSSCAINGFSCIICGSWQEGDVKPMAYDISAEIKSVSGDVLPKRISCRQEVAKHFRIIVNLRAGKMSWQNICQHLDLEHSADTILREFSKQMLKQVAVGK